MSDFRHNPLLAFLIHQTQSALLRQIVYLKAENQILRSRLPKSVQTTPAERATLVRLGSPLGYAIREILGIVHNIKQECLDHFVVLGERHLEHLVREYQDHYNTVRPHQGIGNRPIGVVPFPTAAGPPDPAEVDCATRLGGVLRHYYRKAA